MLDAMSKNIGEAHDYKFQLFILKNSTRNAVARPGGFLYLDQGLLDDAKQAPKAHFALAHEIAHVLQRHETRELQGLIVDSFETKKDLKNALTQSKSDPGAVLDKVKINKDSYSRHHIDQELQADSCAARMLSRAYPNGDQLAVALNAFIQDLPPPEASTAAATPASTSSSGSKAEQLAATAHDIVATPANRHPNTQERVQNLKEIYTELTATVASTT
jgi:predicted Zn-dependent protease